MGTEIPPARTDGLPPAVGPIEIRHGRIYDPAHGVDGQVATLRLEGGRVVGAFSHPETAPRVIDATGAVVMPGGVDVHSHIAGPGINRARRLLADSADPIVASAPRTGRQYAAMGYTTAVEAAMGSAVAAQTHRELAATPHVDAAALMLAGNHEWLLDGLRRGEGTFVDEGLALLLSQTASWGVKAVNPGGVATYKHGGDPTSVTSLDDPLGSWSLTPRGIVEGLVGAVERLGLPHGLHLHANRLGLPGNVALTVETLRALDGRHAHLTHAQFHAYGDDGRGGYTSGAAVLMAQFNACRRVTLDVGQVMFGPALTLTEDTPAEALLWQLLGRRLARVDVEGESACGMMPVAYRHTSGLHALQWAVGLEIFLRAADLWRVALSTDHPNGGSFRSYPRLIATLMDGDVRAAEIARCPPAARSAVERSGLSGLSRLYSLGEIAIVTRAAPARILGLATKGHLGVGADADVTIYDDNPDREAMFAAPRWVIKGGAIVVCDGQLGEDRPGQSWVADLPMPSSQISGHYGRWLSTYGSRHVSQTAVRLPPGRAAKPPK